MYPVRASAARGGGLPPRAPRPPPRGPGPAPRGTARPTPRRASIVPNRFVSPRHTIAGSSRGTTAATKPRSLRRQLKGSPRSSGRSGPEFPPKDLPEPAAEVLAHGVPAQAREARELREPDLPGAVAVPQVPREAKDLPLPGRQVVVPRGDGMADRRAGPGAVGHAEPVQGPQEVPFRGLVCEERQEGHVLVPDGRGPGRGAGP